MGYKYFGFFLAVLIIITGSLTGWIILMYKKEKSIIEKLKYLKQSNYYKEEKN